MSLPRFLFWGPLSAALAFAISLLVSGALFFSGALGIYGQPDDLYHFIVLLLILFITLNWLFFTFSFARGKRSS